MTVQNRLTTSTRTVDRTKHIDKLHFLRSIVNKGLFKVVKIHIDINSGDLLTKVIPV
uniref:Uncharacterized protein n=1 Tax=Cannabis sativa TaxID=3483 RepID=A0A803QDX4_CANSA